MNSIPLLVLIDGSSYLYRAFHALPDLAATGGQPTGAIYGVTNMVRKLLADERPQFAAVIFDAKGKTFRHDIYPEYKANRPPMPDELRSQIPFVHELVKAMGIPLIIEDNVEADDVIATLAEHAANQGLNTLVSTGDKDLAQIVNDRIELVDTMYDRRMDVSGVENKFGVGPDLIADYLALVGDTSDNIPGVPKVGPKTAVKWLKEFGSLDQILENADNIKGKVGENLRLSLDQLPVSKNLATVRRDLEIDIEPDTLEIREANVGALREIFTKLEFNSWLRELAPDASQASSSASATYHTILDEAELDTWIDRLAASELFAFDTETTSLDAMDAQLVGASFAITAGEAVYVPCGHDYENAPAQLSVATVLGKLSPLLEDPDRAKVGQNLKYDSSVLANYGVTLKGIKYDTMLESYVLDSVASRHDMDTLASKHLGHTTISFEQIAGKGKSQLTFNEIAIEQAGPYAAEDAEVTLRLHQTLWPRLKADSSLEQLFRLIEMPLVPVLVRVERNGVRVDADQLAAQSEELEARISELEGKANALAGVEFNIASPKQIQEILYDRLELPVLRKTPKGQPSTAENVLIELAREFELPQLILEHRGLSKLKSTYTRKLPDMVNPRTGRVHTSYHQSVAATGRLSSSDPNLQNIPVRTADGRRIREAFVADPGNLLVAADYSQIELRIMAHLSQDEGLLDAFERGLDVHQATAAEIFDISVAEVSSDQRRHAKAINFGLIYGMSAFGLAQQLKIERSAAQEFMNLYFVRYPGVKRFMDSTREIARDQGYVETVYGRRLYLPDIRSSNHARRQYAERAAINAPMQGTAADIIKMAMLSVDDWLRAEAPEVRMIMQVHDELVFETPKTQVDKVIAASRELMSNAAQLSVPLTVEIGSGANWAQTHP